MRDLLLALLLRFRGDREPGPVKRRVGSWLLRNLPGMLTCAEFEDFVFDYYEGELAEKPRRRFERHMLLCPMCRIHFESYVRAVALGRRLWEEGDERLPDDMPEELIQAILAARATSP